MEWGGVWGEAGWSGAGFGMKQDGVGRGLG